MSMFVQTLKPLTEQTPKVALRQLGAATLGGESPATVLPGTVARGCAPPAAVTTGAAACRDQAHQAGRIPPTRPELSLFSPHSGEGKASLRPLATPDALSLHSSSPAGTPGWGFSL